MRYVLTIMAMWCTGSCVVGCRAGLDAATANTAHVVRVEATRYINAYGQRAIENENVVYDRHVDTMFAALATQPTPANVLQVAEQVKRDARARDLQIDAIRTDMGRAEGYMDMLRSIEVGYTDLWTRQQTLRGMFTGQPVTPLARPDTTLEGGAR